MITTQDDKTLERQRLKEVYHALCEDIAAVLLRHDPLGLNFGLNVDEYAPEARRVVPKLRKAHSTEELRRAIYAVFTSLFGADDESCRQSEELSGQSATNLHVRQQKGDA